MLHSELDGIILLAFLVITMWGVIFPLALNHSASDIRSQEQLDLKKQYLKSKGI